MLPVMFLAITVTLIGVILFAMVYNYHDHTAADTLMCIIALSLNVINMSKIIHLM